MRSLKSLIVNALVYRVSVIALQFVLFFAILRNLPESFAVVAITNTVCFFWYILHHWLFQNLGEKRNRITIYTDLSDKFVRRLQWYVGDFAIVNSIPDKLTFCIDNLHTVYDKAILQNDFIIESDFGGHICLSSREDKKELKVPVSTNTSAHFNIPEHCSIHTLPFWTMLKIRWTILKQINNS